MIVQSTFSSNSKGGKKGRKGREEWRKKKGERNGGREGDLKPYAVQTKASSDMQSGARSDNS